ncbi:MAG: glycoside hydrolase family 3 N-terminal domain-containing protein [Acidobacteriaceae bacterium]
MKTAALRHRFPLRHQVGSLLIVGVESTSLSPLESAWLRSLQPSGILLFRRNIESTAQVHGLWQQAARELPQPFFRCVDLEGGTVDRLRDLVGSTPSAAEVATTHQVALFREHGTFIGRMLHALGFNVDLAPVLDLALPPALPVMKTRVVSPDPADVIAYAGAFLAGLAQYDVLGCGKHFPGLGGGDLDSHRATPSIDRTWQQMWEQDLEPYRALAASLPLITVSHAAYPKIERPPLPASLSRFWIQDVLRGKLRYRGLVTSDDMEMGGVLQDRSPEDAAIDAIAAGTDLLEICQRADRILATHEALLREAERSPAFARCVGRAAKRVATAKQRLLGNSALPRPLTAAGLKQLQAAQQRLWKKIIRANARVHPEVTE